MTQKRLPMVIGGAVLGAVLALPKNLGPTAFPDVLSGLGNGLRALSLSGIPGNLAAWCIVYLLCAPPVVGMLLQWRKRERRFIDFLPALSCLLIFGGLFSLVNPTLFTTPIPEYPQIWAISYWTAALSVLLCWLVLLALSKMERATFHGLSTALIGLLVACAAIFAFSAANGTVNACLVQLESIASSNDSQLTEFLIGLPNSYDTRYTSILLGALSILDLVPSLLGAAVLLWSADFVAAIRQEPFGGQTVALCEKTARGCRNVVAWTVALSVCANLLQLQALPYVTHTSFSVHLPLFTLLLSAALFLLCRCFQRGRELQQDSDSII